MNSKIKKLLKGKTVTVKGEDIVHIAFHVKNLSPENYKKLEKSYEKGKGCRIKLSENELMGSGLGSVISDAKKAGKLAMKSGVADIAIDEAVNLAPLPAIAKKMASKAIKYEAHKLTGTGIKPNPYLPDNLSGGGLQKYGVRTRNGINGDNIVPITSDAYHPNVHNLPPYANPIGYELFHNNSD